MLLCFRGYKGRELLSKPPEVRRSESQKPSRWNNLSSSERVSNWVKQREARRLNKERWAKKPSTKPDDILIEEPANELENIDKQDSCIKTIERFVIKQ